MCQNVKIVHVNFPDNSLRYDRRAISACIVVLLIYTSYLANSFFFLFHTSSSNICPEGLNGYHKGKEASSCYSQLAATNRSQRQDYRYCIHLLALQISLFTLYFLSSILFVYECRKRKSLLRLLMCAYYWVM